LSNPLSTLKQPFDDLVSIGDYLSRLNDIDQAISVLSLALSNNQLSEEDYRIGSSKLAYLYKKIGDYSNAVPLWEKNAALGNMQSCIELAIFYEHKQNDYPEAIHWTLLALEIASHLKLLDTSSDALEHRLSRLKQKIAASQ
jgi:TPR repeat protein